MLDRLRREPGFTLVEMMITSLLLVIVLGATIALLSGTNSHAQRDSERSIAVSEVRAGMNRMVNEIRNAVQVNAANSTQIDFNIRCRSADVPPCIAQTSDVAERRVVYRCDAAFTGTSNLSTASTLYRGCVRTSSVTLSGGECCTAPAPGVATTVPTTAPNNASCGQTGLTADTCSVVIDRVLNWDTVTFPTPVFVYRLNDNTTSSATLTANQLNPRIAGSIEGFDLQIRSPRGGERRRGIAGDILLKDGGYMRNLDLF